MSKSLFSLWIIATLAFLASSAAAGGPQGQNPRPAYLWEITQPLEQDGSGEGLVEVNQNVVAKAKANIRNEGHDELVLEVFPGEFLTCTMKNMDGLLHPDLASNFPQIATLSGHCDDDMTTVLITFNDNLKNSIAVTIHFEGRMLFFADYDSAVSGNPQTLRLRIPQFDPNLDWTDEVIESPEADIGIGVRKLLRAPQFNGRRLNTEATARKFRIAIVATKEFSAARGGTRDAVLTAIVNIMARVNGIFLKELGVMFELIPESGNLVCIAGDSGCNELANDTGIWSQFVSFVGTRGVSSSDYDIGHSFGTLTSALSASGVAARPSLCTSFKHNGLSRFGNSFPFNDSLFFLVTHEIAHQVNGPHSFRDCQGPTHSQLTLSGAVEPGSGSTLMSYAGNPNCDAANEYQSNDDPWFNSHINVIMRNYVDSVSSCGTTIAMSTPKPVMQTQTQCTIPKGNYAQLSGSIANAGDIGSQVFVAWDRVDPGYEDFTDTSVARFAPREPSTRSLRRFLPNMYILSFQPTQLEEIAPQDGGGNQDMTFRFVGRTSFDPTASTTAAFSEELAATFGYSDVSLTFDDSVVPLQLISVPAALQGLQSVNLSWAGGGAGDSIEILVAVNTMTEVTSPDFNKVVEDLDFVSMGSFPNSGSAQVQVPSLENPNNLPVNLMIRSGSQECYYFDLAANLSYEEPVNLPPTTSPSAMPSSTPSRSPTPSPSVAPSIAPSSTPSTSPSAPMPSSAPSSDPSAGPTNLDTTSPTVSSAPTGSPSDFPSLRPSLAPTASPTILPSLKPSTAPTMIPPPSPSPVASPSTAPSSAPSNGPTVAQSASPSGSPSAGPTKNPTTSPTSSPTRAPNDSTSCAVKEENVCGYSLNYKTDQVVSSHFSICIHHIPSNKYSSHCLGEADLLHLEAHQWLPGVLNPNDEVYTCGCCPDDDKSDYCQPREMACPMHVYGGCDLGNNNGQGYGDVGMEVCLENKRGKRRTRCVSPFAEKDAKFAGCGRTCDEPLASNIFDHEIEV